MIIGECPYCDKPQMNCCPDVMPVFGKVTCQDCDEQYWLLYSRIDPIAYTREGFEREYIVDEEAKTIVDRNTSYDVPMVLTKEMAGRIAADIALGVLCGNPDFKDDG
jgi:hypothetical protein